MSWLKDLKRGLQRFGELEQPRAERRPAPGLAAQYGPEIPLASAGIKDISSSGIYLFTEKRLRTGELVTLILQEEGHPENDKDLQVTVHARVARQGEDGMGLSFALPQGMDMDLWGVLVRNIVLLSDQAQVADMFHTLRTVLFLCRLCGSEAEEAIALLGGQLHPDRAATLIKIAHTAEHQLASEPDGERMRAHPKVVANILSDGSWAPDELTTQLWSGLLVSSCSVDPPDDSNQVFVSLLVHVTPVQARIFNLACERALAAAPEHEKAASGRIVLTPREMVELTDVHDRNRAASDLAYLFNLGLLQKVFDFTSYQEVEGYDITPSELGLELYRHCHGQRGKLDPRLVEEANRHLTSFLPAAQPADPDNQNPPLPMYRAES